MKPDILRGVRWLAGRQASLARRLVWWVLAALLVVWGGFVAMAYRTGVHEAGELTDGLLAGTAALMVNLDLPPFVPPAHQAVMPPLGELKSHDYQPSLSVVIRDGEGHLLARSGEAPLPDATRREGFINLVLGDPGVAWRSFSHWDAARSRQVTVLVKAEERDDLAEDVAGQLAGPGLWLLPVVAIALGLAIWRGLQPLQALSRDVAGLEVGKADRLQAHHPYREFNSVVGSINQMLAQQQAAMERERQLASEVAHELRTPLSSIALQAAALRGPLAEAARDQAMQQINADALRAGHVITQLLALARASRADLRQQMAPVDLARLARGVVAGYAQAAWKSGHELSVQGDDSLQIAGHPLLLELALRNLVENALQHTPAGTAVCVQWGRDGEGAWIEVCDTGITRDDSATPDAVPATSSERLGLGHKIVGRVMDVHGGHFRQLGALPPHTHRYRLSFGVLAA